MGTVTALPAARAFWGEMAPCDHVVQIYGDDRVFIDALEGFVGNALREGESAIVIATAPHLHGLERRLREHGVDVERARDESRYVERLAEETLESFLVNGWPDERLFAQCVGELLALARGKEGRKVRAFGEMVAILWARGRVAATLQLELMWTRLCESQDFPLFCAYPRDGFTKNAAESIVDICRAHSRVVP
jgi:MEDS: MEthanogen/methylotroph, DcmR Sensory domain